MSARDCFEKHELADRVASTTPSTCRAHGSTFGSRWKAAFAAAQAEGSRRDITKEDLCDLAWTLYMPMHGDPNHVAYERQQNFKPDFTYNSFMVSQVAAAAAAAAGRSFGGRATPNHSIIVLPSLPPFLFHSTTGPWTGNSLATIVCALGPTLH